MNLWQTAFDFIIKLIEKLTGFVSAFFAGRGYERTKELKGRLNDAEGRSNIIGLSDADLARRLRERAARKRKD